MERISKVFSRSSLEQTFFLSLFLVVLIVFLVIFPSDALAIVCGCSCYDPEPGTPGFDCWRIECEPNCNPDESSCIGYQVSSCDGCFTGEAKIGVRGTERTYGTREIKDLKEEDVVSSFDPETGEVREGTVSDIQKLTREGYYELETESGKKVKVTAEHPFLAVENESFVAKIKKVFSQTLTYRVITGLESKLSGILR